MVLVLLTNNNVVNPASGANILVYSFQQGGVQFKNNEISLASAQLYYSWYNINQTLYNNSTYSYTWIDGSTVTVTMPDGNYSVAEINTYLESVMVQNNHYLVNTTNGDFVFYIQFETNATYYAVQLNCYVVPSVLPIGYNLPAGSTWTLPAIASTPQVNILANGFRDIIGFSSGSYPPVVPQASTYSTLSTVAPQVNPVSSIQLSCSIVTNPYSSQSRVIYATGIPDTLFGSQIIINPVEFAFTRLVDGTYNQFTIEIQDQNGRPIFLRDPQISILLVVRDRGTNQ
jgi:hypothetical protein